MKKKDHNTKLPALLADPADKINLHGYPFYPEGDDIYVQSREIKNINPEDLSPIKEGDENEKPGTNNEKDFEDDLSGDDLDVPGSELDDSQEAVGSEDEENNLYSPADD